MQRLKLTFQGLAVVGFGVALIAAGRYSMAQDQFLYTIAGVLFYFFGGLAVLAGALKPFGTIEETARKRSPGSPKAKKSERS